MLENSMVVNQESAWDEYEGWTPSCPQCGASKLETLGFNPGARQYECQECGEVWDEDDMK